MYSLSKIRDDFVRDKYLFCGAKGNIGLAWKEAAEVMGLDLYQCCGRGYEIEDITIYHDIKRQYAGKILYAQILFVQKN